MTKLELIDVPPADPVADPVSDKLRRGGEMWNQLAEMVRDSHKGLGKGYSDDFAMYALSELGDEDVRAIAYERLNAWRCELDRLDAANYLAEQDK